MTLVELLGYMSRMNETKAYVHHNGGMRQEPALRYFLYKGGTIISPFHVVGLMIKFDKLS